MNESQITIFLTTAEAEIFKSYQQFHATFALLIQSGAFDIKGGSFTCHLDSNGSIQKIDRDDTLFDARKKISTFQQT